MFIFHVHSFPGDDNHDIAYDEPLTEDVGDVHGDVNDDLELQVAHNPYYGGEIETNHSSSRMPSNNMPDMQIITCRQNDYYEM